MIHFDTDPMTNPDLILGTALLQGMSYEEAATSAGCSRSTVSRRMNDPGFRARLDGLRAETLARVADVLAAEAIESVATLARIRSDPEVSPSIQARAAATLIDSALRYRASVDLDQRVAAMESALKRRK
jgi:transcriptional regulator with XRE-family HTH domain